MKIYAMVRQGTGEYKSQCDDRILVGNVILDNGYYEVENNSENLKITIAVADGAGSSGAGWFAAQNTLEGIKYALNDNDIFDENEVTDIMRHINNRLNEMIDEHEQIKESESTLSMLKIVNGEVVLVHLGDSRIYSANGENKLLKRLTTDQNKLNKIKDMPENEGRSISQMMNDPGATHITGYMGSDAERFDSEIVVTPIGINKNNQYIITTDGIHDYIDTEVMSEILFSDKSPREKMLALMDEARREPVEGENKEASEDDQSIIYIDFSDERGAN